MNEALNNAIEELKKQVNSLTAQIIADGRMAELQKLLTALNTLEGLCGQSKTTLGEIFSFGPVASVKPGIHVEPDEFVGLEPLEAAKRYLKKPKKAALIQDIVAAIRAGGGDPGNEEKLKVSLARSTWDVIKIGDDRFGLLEFYPHIKRGKKKKNGVAKDEAPDSASGEIESAEASADIPDGEDSASPVVGE